ncbi:MAG: adenylate/guanylate cyclase domain-containing protein, partial [Acidobacteriota bacterium]
PTLIIHRKNDHLLKVEEGRFMAATIPGAKLVELPGADHLPFVGDQEAILDEIEEFLTGVRHSTERDTVLATVLATEIADAASQEQALGRDRWSQMIGHLHEHVRREIELFKGREVEHKAGRVLATFDGPARAIRAACAINDAAKRLRIGIQTGLHTGECEVIGDRLGGLAVAIGTEVARQAAVGEVLVSSTVKDLVAGSGIEFKDRGPHVLEGVPGEWRIFTVVR